MTKKFAVLLALIAMVSAVKADPSAGAIRPACQAFIDGSATDLDRFQCMGPILALTMDGCIPRDETMGKVVLVILQYIDGQRARLNEDFKKLALEAIRNTWPCQR